MVIIICAYKMSTLLTHFNELLFGCGGDSRETFATVVTHVPGWSGSEHIEEAWSTHCFLALRTVVFSLGCSWSTDF